MANDPKDAPLSVDDILGPELSAKLTNKAGAKPAVPGVKPAVPPPPAASAPGTAPAPLAVPAFAPKPPAAAPLAIPRPVTTATVPSAAGAPPKSAGPVATIGATGGASVTKSGVTSAPFMPSTGPVATPKPAAAKPAEESRAIVQAPAPPAAALAAAGAALAAVPSPPVVDPTEAVDEAEHAPAPPAAALAAAAAPLAGDASVAPVPTAAPTPLALPDETGPVENTAIIERPTSEGRPTAELVRGLFGKPPRFPTTAIGDAVVETARYVRAWPLGWTSLAAAALVAALAAIGWNATRGRASVLYVADEQTLWAGPANNVFERVATLERNDEVRPLATDGDFTLVRDGVGRAGFVLSSHLATTAQPVTGDQPFTRCARRLGEADPSLCHGRGHAQLAACQAGCAKAPSPTDCANLCDARLRACIEGCDLAAAAAPVAAPAIPTPPAAVDPGAVDAAPPAEDADAAAAEEEHAKKPGAKKKPAKKKIVKKKKK